MKKSLNFWARYHQNQSTFLGQMRACVVLIGTLESFEEVPCQNVHVTQQRAKTHSSVSMGIRSNHVSHHGRKSKKSVNSIYLVR